MGPNRLIAGVVEAHTDTTLGFDQYLMATIDQLAHASGRHANAVFVVFNFLGDAYDHACISSFTQWLPVLLVAK